MPALVRGYHSAAENFRVEVFERSLKEKLKIDDNVLTLLNKSKFIDPTASSRYDRFTL